MSRLWGSCRSKRKARWHLKYQREKPDDIWNITQKHFLEICKLPKWSWQQWFSIFHAIMVDCPTRWSPWYWYLEFYVDRYPDDQEILYSLSSLLFRLLDVLLILSWKSFHWRHSFSDILKWRFLKSKIWITMKETGSPSSRFSPKCWKVKVFPSSSLIRFICHYPLSHKTGDKGALLFVPLLPGSPRPPSRPWKAPSNVQPCQKLQTQVER